MRKRVILALLLVVALAATSSCSLVVKDAEVDKQTVIVEVAGKTFTKGDISTRIANALSYQAYMYSMYGMNFDPTSAEAISSAQDSVINTLVQNAVLEKKQADMGLSFTQEEQDAMRAEAETSYQSYVDSVKSGDFAETELTGEELDAAIAAKMTEYGYPTVDQLVQESMPAKIAEKMKAEVTKDVTVTDEEIQTEYDAQVKNAQEQYASSPAAYGTAVQNGSTVYYAPAGYRYVKHILRNFLEADKTKIDDLNSRLTEKQTQLTNTQTSLTGLGEDASADDEATAKSRKELTDTQTTLNAEIADLQAQLGAAKEAGYAALQPSIEEIQAKIAEGQDFDALVAEYSEDPGAKNEPAKTNGYPVSADSTNWVAEFKEAALALAAIGDVSAPVHSSFGIHLIKYVSDIAEGATPLDQVKDAVQASVLSAKKDELYQTTLAQWVTEASAKIYKDRLN